MKYEEYVVAIVPMEFKYFEGEDREQVPIECLI